MAGRFQDLTGQGQRATPRQQPGDPCDALVQALFDQEEPPPHMPQEMWDHIVSGGVGGLATLGDYEFGNRTRPAFRPSNADCPVTSAVKLAVAARVAKMTADNYARALRSYLSHGIYRETRAGGGTHFYIQATRRKVGVLISKVVAHGWPIKLRMVVRTEQGAKGDFQWDISHDTRGTPPSLRFSHGTVYKSEHWGTPVLHDSDDSDHDGATELRYGSGGKDLPAREDAEMNSIGADRELEQERVREIARALRLPAKRGEMLMGYLIRVCAEYIRGIAVAHMTTEQASRLKNTKELLDGAIGF